ncbi:metallophosphoesterase [Gracilibacillus caseinilyticus]|uniref:Metallophosphoesterase n=1 Tax=Gracilibacillus caseinilyticus TaxID=2932256 RepID=A0ABY4EUR0_9BACI|nr:metallophosphoesterase [Gracilibacillus caseinilyticus]UOQ47384.1 metallophosphoesterase [Gracilibacillus caseinilyticus]
MNNKKMYGILLIITGCMIAIVVGIKVYYDTNALKVAEVQLSNEKLNRNQSIQILQISDLHNKQFGEDNQKLLEKVIQLEPDVVVLTGDIVDRSTENIDDVLSFVEQLSISQSPVFYVSGNHDWDNPLHESLFKGLREAGVNILDNQNVQILLGHTSFQIAGVVDLSTGQSNIEHAVKGLDHQIFTVLLSHTPPVNQGPLPNEIDLIISGHTHGGQVRLPFIGAVVAPDQGFFPTYDQGLFALSVRQQLYIDSGIGTSMLPIRFLNQSQITLITISGA